MHWRLVNLSCSILLTYAFVTQHCVFEVIIMVLYPRFNNPCNYKMLCCKYRVTTSLRPSCHTPYLRAFTTLHCIFEVLTFGKPKQAKYFQNAIRLTRVKNVWKPLNVTTFGPAISDHINRIITISDCFYLVIFNTK